MIDQAQYVRDAVRTENTPAEIRYSRRAVLAILGAHIATGQMVDQLKKNLIYGKPVDPAKRRAALAQVNRTLELLQNSDQPPEPLTVNARVFHAAVGMATESVEMLEALLKAIEGEPLDYVNLTEELGDAAWYEAILLDETGADKGEILERNIAKLKARYGDKFTAERAIHRDLAGERAVLEGAQVLSRRELDFIGEHAQAKAA